jgi:hypothetical protein
MKIKSNMLLPLQKYKIQRATQDTYFFFKQVGGMTGQKLEKK